MTNKAAQFEIGCVTRLGNRAINQDRCDIILAPSRALLVLADGLGGHPRGELAAQVFVETMTRLFQEYRQPIITDPSQFLHNAIENAHDAINRAGVLQHPPVDPCTTAVAAFVQNNIVWWSYVGDSRFYLIRQGEAIVKSRDHSYVEELYRGGHISNHEKQLHPMRNLVSRCLGGTITYPVIDNGKYADLKPGDVILLCSDGLWSALDDIQIATGSEQDDLQDSVRNLAKSAEQSAAPCSDNIAISALRWHPLDGEEDKTAQDTTTQQADPLCDAISAISDAIQEYGAEMEPVKQGK